MKHGSLFSGIGGFDLAAEWLGWENVFHCEYAEFPRKILSYHFPNSISYYDIKETDFSIHKGQIDVLSGGFPCQPYSTAGLRRGKQDERHLWPEMLRAIREVKPRYVVGENVRGLVNWDNGMVFDEVQTDLEAEGYEVQAFILPACGVNAPHKRDRVFFIAYTNYRNDRRTARKNEGTRRAERLQERHKVRQSVEPNKAQRKATNCRTKKTVRSDWGTFPTEPALCGRNDGLSRELDGITFSKWHKESIKAYGNAVVPQLVYNIFKAIETLENE